MSELDLVDAGRETLAEFGRGGGASTGLSSACRRAR
jgi:hypothetical protein